MFATSIWLWRLVERILNEGKEGRVLSMSKVTVVIVLGREFAFEIKDDDRCSCHCHNFDDGRPDCLHWAQPCCFICDLCGERVKRAVYQQHFHRHLSDYRLKMWQVIEIISHIKSHKGKEGRLWSAGQDLLGKWAELLEFRLWSLNL